MGSRLSGSYRITSVVHLYGSNRPYVTRFVCGGKESRSLTDLTRARTAAAPVAARPAWWSAR